MTDANEIGLLREMLSRPWDADARGPYADWLEEQGRPEAELVRLGAGMQKTAPSPAREALRRRFNQLADQVRRHYREKLQEALPPEVKFGVTIDPMGTPRLDIGAHALLAHGEKLFQAAPWLHGLWLDDSGDLRAEERERLFGMPQLEGVVSLHARPFPFGAGDGLAQSVAASPHLRNLAWLDLGGNGIGPAGAHALAYSPGLSQLVRLDLGGNNLGAQGAQSIASSSYAGCGWWR